MAPELARFSVAMPVDLLERFDDLVERRGVAKNRSEAVRDLVRDALIEEECATPDSSVFGSLTIAYDHHANDLQEKLHSIQHHHCDAVISTMHVHLDAHFCLEVIILKGKMAMVQEIADMILGCKGVKNGRLVVTKIDEHM